ncbi:MAG: protein kinase [Gemmatimonadota bacterium]|nr:protein kinase [Gemmatimonadota bacterium]
MPPTDALRSALADRYSIEGELGSGGMATVYLARDLKHDREVALKVLRSDLSAMIGTQRFLSEIRIAARLDHPNILTLIDSGSADGMLYYVLPYVRGESLRAKLDRERQLEVKDALSITTQVASALDYAHAQGLVHRDIKPENILLHQGAAVLADFGIALAVREGGGDRLTETGLSLGTPRYMSPEQAMGERSVDHRSDVYSLGAVFYEMMAGEPPITGPSAQAIIAKLLTQTPVKLRVMRGTIPLAMEQATEKALAKAPADRFASAGEFVRALSATATPERSAMLGGSRLKLAAIAAATVAVIGTGSWFVWEKTRAPERMAGAISGDAVNPRAAVVRLAVLPFENLGRAEDAYFADGMSDEVRVKLASVPGIEVIARASSNEYRRTSKSPRGIARELGVRYLLTGTVRYEKITNGAAASSGRLRVTPELVDVNGELPPVSRWGRPFDAPLAGVFDVQANIAQQVAEALSVNLGIGERTQLTARPTDNLTAYDAFLQGEEVSDRMLSSDPPVLRRAIRFYERAVAADSTFAQAWARLSEARGSLFMNSPGVRPDSAAIRRAAERAISLAPRRPEGRRALGYHYLSVENDPRRAAAQFELARQMSPNDAELLSAAAWAEKSLGRWTDAIPRLRRATLLDPRSALIALMLGETQLWTRQYSSARETFDRGLALAPANLGMLEDRAMVELAEGNLSGARAVIRRAPKDVTTSDLVANFALYFDLSWVLDEAHQRVLIGLGPEAFDNDRAGWGLALADVHALRGDAVRARAFADSAHRAFEELIRASPADAQLGVLHGVTLAYLGRRNEAVREGQRGASLGPVTRDAWLGSYVQHQVARIYILVGEHEMALDHLELLLKMPYYLSPGWLRIDPNFAPLRGNPRFDRLAAGKAVVADIPATIR